MTTGLEVSLCLRNFHDRRVGTGELAPRFEPRSLGATLSERAALTRVGAGLEDAPDTQEAREIRAPPGAETAERERAPLARVGAGKEARDAQEAFESGAASAAASGPPSCGSEVDDFNTGQRDLEATANLFDMLLASFSTRSDIIHAERFIVGSVKLNEDGWGSTCKDDSRTSRADEIDDKVVL